MSRTKPRAHRTVVKSVRYTPEEWTRVERKAAEARLSPARFVREVALGGGRFHGRVVREAIHQLARVGNNLNQMTRLANALGRVDLSARLEAVLEEVEDGIRRLVP